MPADGLSCADRILLFQPHQLFAHPRHRGILLDHCRLRRLHDRLELQPVCDGKHFFGRENNLTKAIIWRVRGSMSIMKNSNK